MRKRTVHIKNYEPHTTNEFLLHKCNDEDADNDDDESPAAVGPAALDDIVFRSGIEK